MFVCGRVFVSVDDQRARSHSLSPLLFPPSSPVCPANDRVADERDRRDFIRNRVRESGPMGFGLRGRNALIEGVTFGSAMQLESGDGSLSGSGDRGNSGYVGNNGYHRASVSPISGMGAGSSSSDFHAEDNHQHCREDDRNEREKRAAESEEVCAVPVTSYPRRKGKAGEDRALLFGNHGNADSDTLKRVQIGLFGTTSSRSRGMGALYRQVRVLVAYVIMRYGC